jgi:hypothetical protein
LVQCQGSVPFFKRRGSEIRSIPHHIFESTYCTFPSTECLHRYPSDTSISCAIHQRNHPSHSTLHSYPPPEPEPEPSSLSIAPTIIAQQNHPKSPEPSLLLTRTIITTHQNHHYSQYYSPTFSFHYTSSASLSIRSPSSSCSTT